MFVHLSAQSIQYTTAFYQKIKPARSPKHEALIVINVLHYFHHFFALIFCINKQTEFFHRPRAFP